MTELSKRPKGLYKNLFSFILPFWPMFLVGIVANICYSGLDASLTYLLRPFLDKGLIAVEMDFIKKIPLIIFLAITFRGAMSAIGNYCMSWVARSLVKALRQRVFRHLIYLPASTYQRITSSELLSKILYDVEQIAHVSADALTDLVQNSCLVLGLLVVMFVVCWQLSLMFLITIPFVAVLVKLTNKRVRRLSHKVQETMGEVTEIAAEAIEGYEVVKIYKGENYEINKFDKATEHSWRMDMKVAVSKAINVSGVQLIIAVSMSLIILAAIHLSTQIVITPGSFLAVIAAMLQLIKPLKTLATLNSVIQQGLAGAESIFRLLALPQEKEGTETKTICEQKGALRFENVSFAYDEKTPVLNQLNISIKAGETVALVGPSGSGKTTLVGLLPRFYELSSGQILLDEQPIQTLPLSTLREQIALVSQHTILFNDTIANNIAYGCIDASQEEIQQAAHAAFADEFIQRLPEGYETIIGENGNLLSGGQRQRIAIARAILKKAPLLILDEATSALDNESERYIQAALEAIMGTRTTLVVAHRLSTIQRADKILVLDQGQIIEQGNHQELLALKGHYYQLYFGQKTESIAKEEELACLSG